MRGSDTAAQSIGINPARQKLVVFVVGAAVAGFGGGLVASYFGAANYSQSFTFFFSLVWVVLVITAGARLVQAAVIGGITFFLFPALLDKLFSWPGTYLTSHPETSGLARSFLEFFNPAWSLGVAFILFGLGALTYAKHPEGIIEAQGSVVAGRIIRRFSRRPATDTDSPEPPPGNPPPDLAPPVDVLA